MDEVFEEIFEPGNIVKLRSGGPKMTVEKYHKRDVIKCVWFDGSEVKVGYFRQGFLELVDVDNLVCNRVK
jgi:uncharacterized protein YodC (DUF2158 family)